MSNLPTADPNKGFPNPDVADDEGAELHPGTGAGTSLPATPKDEAPPNATLVSDPNAGAPVAPHPDQAEPGDTPTPA